MSIQQTVISDNLASEGPWGYELVPPDARYEIPGAEQERYWITDRNGEVIASVYVVAGREAEAEANARLLGAAQHLLAELKDARAFCPVAVQDRIDAIIAAAEGR